MAPFVVLSELVALVYLLIGNNDKAIAFALAGPCSVAIATAIKAVYHKTVSPSDRSAPLGR
jgi:uncharacterized membrane protein YphA (DoxX/SURF4 family)